MEVPWEYVCLRATRYVNGAIAPDEWDERSEELYPWLEYALLAESVENEIAAEDFAKKNPKQAAPARKPFHHAVFNQE